MSSIDASLHPRLSRRDLLKTAMLSAAVPAASACAPRVMTHTPIATGGVVVFQGDSITDAGRGGDAPNNMNALGGGYPLLIASVLIGTGHTSWRCYNRGVSGDKMPDLEARWATDTLALKPDIVSVLIGVNDFTQHHDPAFSYPGTVADYETHYVALLMETRRVLPTVRLVVLEPFLGRCGVVQDDWWPEFNERREAAARVARRVGATFVPLQDELDRRAKATRPEDWVADGTHPTLAGHAVIAAQWRLATGL